jgi:hypothetical protein
MNLILPEEVDQLRERIISDVDIDLLTICRFLALVRDYDDYKRRYEDVGKQDDLRSRRADLARRILAEDEHALRTDQLENIADVIFGNESPLLTMSDPTQVPTDVTQIYRDDAIKQRQSELLNVAGSLIARLLEVTRPLREAGGLVLGEHWETAYAEWVTQKGALSDLPHGTSL